MPQAKTTDGWPRNCRSLDKVTAGYFETRIELELTYMIEDLGEFILINIRDHHYKRSVLIFIFFSLSTANVLICARDLSARLQDPQRESSL
jgi:hypothetical protein